MLENPELSKVRVLLNRKIPVSYCQTLPCFGRLNVISDAVLPKVPLLVLGNKVDNEQHMTHDNVIQALNLDYITENKWTMINISCTRNINLDKVVEWLTANSK